MITKKGAIIITPNIAINSDKTNVIWAMVIAGIQRQ